MPGCFGASFLQGIGINEHAVRCRELRAGMKNFGIHLVAAGRLRGDETVDAGSVFERSESGDGWKESYECRKLYLAPCGSKMVTCDFLSSSNNILAPDRSNLFGKHRDNKRMEINRTEQKFQC